MSIKTKAELLTVAADNQQRLITPANIRDLIDSMMEVGGTMYCQEEVVAVTTAWSPFPGFTNSIDSKGLTEDLVNGLFTVGAGAGGLYKVDTSMGVNPPGNGWIEIALTKNGGLTPYRKKRTLVAGNDGAFSIHATGNVADGDTIGLAWRAGANANVTVSAEYRAFR